MRINPPLQILEAPHQSPLSSTSAKDREVACLVDGPRRSPRRPSPGSAEEPRPKSLRADEHRAPRRRLSTGPAKEDPFCKQLTTLLGVVAAGKERQRAHNEKEATRNEQNEQLQQAILRELQRMNAPRGSA